MRIAGFRLRHVLVASFAGWTFVGVFFLAQSLARGVDIPFASAAANLESVWLWALFSPAIVAVSGRFPLERGRLSRTLGAHLVCAAGFAVTDAAVDTPVLATLGLSAGFAELLVREAHINVFSYVGVATAAYAAIHRRAAGQHRARAARLERQFLAARLDALTTRLRPHFLFNALNSIAALIRFESRDQALAALTSLSDLLRDTLEVAGDQCVPLDNELRWLERYLDLVHLRYRERLGVEVEVSDEARRALVPALLLQPLVENAIQHGVERRVGASTLRVEGECDNGDLRLVVRDLGDDATSEDVRGLGFGLDATRERLAHLYGDNGFVLDLAVSSRGSVARVRLPFREPA